MRPEHLPWQAKREPKAKAGMQQGHYEVERIEKARRHKGQWQYLIKWEGWRANAEPQRHAKEETPP